jgi:tetrahydromethanopterin S-methyltransferase subunit E
LQCSNDFRQFIRKQLLSSKRDTHNNEINIFLSDLGNLDSSAFANEYFAFFGSCRTGNVFGGVNFAQEWANLTNGTVKAATGFNGRTDYSYIFPDDRNPIYKALYKVGVLKSINKASREIAREEYGFSAGGSISYPTPAWLSWWETFNPKK